MVTIRLRRLSIAVLVSTLAACSSAPGLSEGSPPVGSTVAPPSSATSTMSVSPFPVATFAAISEDQVTEELAATFQTALDDLVESDGFGGQGGMTATVMTAEGTWSGATGTANGVRDLQVDDQFAVASITKSVVAAQVMLMVEAGEVGLDDPVADHLPADLGFDTNQATIRDLLGHRSGIPDYYDLLYDSQQTEMQRVWTPAEILESLPAERAPAGGGFAYTETNYLLLSLMIEHVRGLPLVEVLRDGSLAVDGLERLVYQPEERPTEPMAMPAGASDAALEIRGGYLPSLASTSAFHASGAIASDAPSLARWWRALCAGEIVSQASLTEMSDFDPDVSSFDGGYGLGLFNTAFGHAQAVGHQGELFGYMSWAACLPEDGAVVVVLSNREVHELSADLFFRPIGPFVEVLREG